MSVTLLLGGQKSGKSSAAARLAEASGRPVVVIAPAVATDGEFAARIARHRADRPGDWSVEETFDVAAALRGVGSGSYAIVDALDTWLFEVMRRHDLVPADDDLTAPDADAWQAALDDVDRLAEAATVGPAGCVVVAGQPGLGPIGATALVRRYADLHGLATQTLATVADRTLFVIAGRAVDLDELDRLPRS